MSASGEFLPPRVCLQGRGEVGRSSRWLHSAWGEAQRYSLYLLSKWGCRGPTKGGQTGPLPTTTHRSSSRLPSTSSSRSCLAAICVAAHPPRLLMSPTPLSGAAYLAYVSQLNQVVMMGTQLYHDACVPQHHKYCAHQIALLYVS